MPDELFGEKESGLADEVIGVGVRTAYKYHSMFLRRMIPSSFNFAVRAAIASPRV